ncbi:MAG: PPC domain-containing protein [Planctomycetota bacterium]|jgi:hypothetical protein
MRQGSRLLALLGLTSLLPIVHAAPVERRPYIGYVCAAGGRQGSTVRVRVGGQNLRGVKRVLVSGEGVTGKVVRYEGRSGRLKPDQRRELAKRLRRIQARRAAEFAGKARGRKAPRKKKQDAEKQEPVALPDHPLLRSLEKLTPRELKKVADYFFDPTQRQQESPQIAETVLIDVVIDPEAAPGDRELRLGTPLGLTNPIVFQVGLLPEFFEDEPNDFATSRQATVTPPVVLNGQVSVRDVDHFRFAAKKGQRLVIEAQARRLVPYLADAVPGWFQATMSIRDAKGREVCFGDDYRFRPDPVLLFEVPEDGDYVLTIRDAIHRGREDFVYRVTVGEQPFITRMFPLGGRTGGEVLASVAGWNLPWRQVRLDTGPGAGPIRRTAWREGERISNAVAYAVGDLPECRETEPDDTSGTAQRIVLPQMVNGRIGEPGDVDVFRFIGRAGEEVVAELSGRRLDSPLDSVLELTDAAGRRIALSDDEPDRGLGLVTHQADSYLRVRLPADGDYFVRLIDARGHGGDEYAYRLRVGPPRPDFQVIVTPSSLNMNTGGTIPITVHALRKDGFTGDIALSLVDAPQGFVLAGKRIPAGRDRIRVTLTAPQRPPDRPLPLRIDGRAEIGGRSVARQAVPAEDMMQAFGLRHLVAAQELLVEVRRSRRWPPPMRRATPGPVPLPVGGTARVRIVAPGLPSRLGSFHFELDEPPEGVTLRAVQPSRRGLDVVLEASAGKAKPGLADNLIVAAYVEAAPRGRSAKDKAKAKTPQPKRRYYIGVLPAIPVEVVAR